MAPSYMYVYPHICNHFSWLRAWCWSVWKSTRGDKCRSYMELVGRCTGFFPLCKYLVHQYIFERPPAYIHCHPILGGPLWVRRSPHSTCVNLCFYNVCCMGESLSKPVKRSPHMCLLANVHQPKLSPLFALAPRALMVGPIPQHSFWPEHNVFTNSYCRFVWDCL